MMTAYRVFRYGFNAANNSSRGARPEDCTQLLATVEADSEEAAVAVALTDGATVYNNQTVWAEAEADCLARERAEASKHEGQVLVKYWAGTTAIESWCASVEEIDDCLDLHSNSYPPTFFDADGDELDYESACETVGG
jgi:hypothetical protein